MLHFTVSQRNQIAVISMTGHMVLDTLDTLDKCLLQIETLPIHLLVLNLTEVKEISEEALRPLTLIQSIARRSNITLRVFGLSDQLTIFLLKRGAIRKTEVYKSLLEALKTAEVKQAA